ncbi:TniQ family protein [Mesorhizobium sp. 10J20-29]
MLDRRSDASVPSIPPIPRWGLIPFKDEPAHGFFLRLAALNGQESIRPFAMTLGVNGRNIKPQEMLQLCENLPIEGLDRLRDCTPILNDAFVSVRGEHLRVSRDWSVRNRRYCPDCISECSYHRYWFDLTILRTCPFHGTVLHTEIGGFTWAWGKSPSQTFRTVGNNKGDVCSPTPFSAYVYGRLNGLARLQLPELDDLSLSKAIGLLILLGRISIYGWQKTLPRDDWLASRQRAAEAGYLYLAEGGRFLRSSRTISSPRRINCRSQQAQRTSRKPSVG